MFAGSIEYDNHNDVWTDQIVRADTYEELIQRFKSIIQRRKNAAVFFAIEMRDNKEIDITKKVRSECVQ